MATAQETGVKTPDTEPKQSERFIKVETADYTLPAPLQVKERVAAKAEVKAKAKAEVKAEAKAAKAKTLTPKNEIITEDEAQLDKDTVDMEKSIHETKKKKKKKKQLGAMVDKKRLHGKKANLVCLKEKFEKSQKKIKRSRRRRREQSWCVNFRSQKRRKIKKESTKNIGRFGVGFRLWSNYFRPIWVFWFFRYFEICRAT